MIKSFSYLEQYGFIFDIFETVQFLHSGRG